MSFTNNNLAQEIINKFCTIDDRSVYIDYEIFKTIANDMTYDIITNLLVFNLKQALISNETFIIHLSLKRLTLKELDKHYNYITKICSLFKFHTLFCT